MGFIIRNNYGPNIEVNEGGVVHFQQTKEGLWQTVDAEVVDVEIDGSDTKENKHKTPPEELSIFAPKKNMQELLKQKWFADVRTDEKYDAEWTDGFIEALMASEHRDGIARDWAVQGKRNKRTQIKGYVVGLLVDAGVLKGSYDGIAARVRLTDDPRSFSRYMGEGKRQVYADWVKEYVAQDAAIVE